MVFSLSVDIRKKKKALRAPRLLPAHSAALFVFVQKTSREGEKQS